MLIFLAWIRSPVGGKSRGRVQWRGWLRNRRSMRQCSWSANSTNYNGRSDRCVLLSSWCNFLFVQTFSLCVNIDVASGSLLYGFKQSHRLLQKLVYSLYVVWLSSPLAEWMYALACVCVCVHVYFWCLQWPILWSAATFTYSSWACQRRHFDCLAVKFSSLSLRCCSLCKSHYGLPVSLMRDVEWCALGAILDFCAI